MWLNSTTVPATVIRVEVHLHSTTISQIPSKQIKLNILKYTCGKTRK